MARRTDEIGFGGLRLIQDTDYFCYGTDAVLLADFASSGKFRTAADLGTNNGIIPLLLSELTAAEKITGIELQTEAAALASENVAANGLLDRINIVNADVLDVSKILPKGSFEAVTANPPYFQAGGGLLTGDPIKRAARHEITAALRRFHLPPEVIFILDTTLRYLVLLGDQASLLLTSLKLRSVGHNPRKHRAMAGIMGIVMQRSQRLSLEMAEAMRCRCFTGEYPVMAGERRRGPLMGRLILLALLALYAFLYLRLEGFF